MSSQSSIMNTLKISHKLRSELRHQGRAELKRAGFPEEISPLEELEDFLDRQDDAASGLAFAFVGLNLGPDLMDEREDLLFRLKSAREKVQYWLDTQIKALEANPPD
jgi:hypothetical protein